MRIMLSNMSIKSKFVGSFLGLAVGDALGMATESKSKEEIQRRFGLVTGYHEGYLPAGHYTDDTQQAIILSESLLENNGFDRNHYVTQLRANTDHSRGMGPSLMKFLLTGENSNESKPAYPSNGLAMKIAPVALFYHSQPEKIIPAVRDFSMLTHKHPGSLAGAIAIAESVKYALDHDEIDLSDYLKTICSIVRNFDELLFKMISEGQTVDDGSCSVYSTVPEAILEFAKDPTDFKTGVINLVNSGGDSDTKAAMFGAISGAYNGNQGIPTEWVAGLENKDAGKDYIVNLAERLYDHNFHK